MLEEDDNGQGRLFYPEFRPPGQVVFHGPQDATSIITDMQTIEYEIYNRRLFPSAADLSVVENDDDHGVPVEPMQPMRIGEGRQNYGSPERRNLERESRSNQAHTSNLAAIKEEIRGTSGRCRPRGDTPALRG